MAVRNYFSSERAKCDQNHRMQHELHSNQPDCEKLGTMERLLGYDLRE